MEETKQKTEGKEATQKKKQKALWKGYLFFFGRVAAFLLLLGIFFTKVLFFERVDGMQMFPSLKDGDLALGYALEEDYRPNDIVVYQQNGETCFGRILAMEGSTVNIDGSGAVFINGAVESGEILYPSYDAGTLTYPYEVPQESLFLLGDYRTETKDSRTYGAISLKQIKGKVLTILRRRGL